jgi:hypothetical protein
MSKPNPGFTLNAVKEDGKLSLTNERRYRELVKRLPDGPYDITIEKYVARRSNQQNKYFHAVVVPILADYWGLDPEMPAEFAEAKELIKLHCNAKTVELTNKTTGEVKEVTIGGSTSALDKEQWGLFIDRCQRWAAMEFGVVIPDPDPEWMFNKTDAA